MPAELLMIAVNWYGPFSSLAETRAKGIEEDLSEILYLAISTDGENDAYVGISNDPSHRLMETHHVLGNLDAGSAQFWIGTVSSQGIAGRRSTQYVTHSEVLNVAEHMLAFFLQTSMNKRKRRSKPSRSAVVLNRWFKNADPYDRHKQRPHPDWPDLLEYEESEDFARNVWFGGRVEKFDNDAIETLKRNDGD